MENNDLLQMVRSKAQGWLTDSYDEETRAEVRAMLDKEDPTDLIESFYKDLEFGTGGLRGIMGAGSNRMNIYTVGAATQGLSDMTVETTAANSLKYLQIFSPPTALKYIYLKVYVQLRKCHTLSASWVAKAVLS